MAWAASVAQCQTTCKALCLIPSTTLKGRKKERREVGMEGERGDPTSVNGLA